MMGWLVGAPPTMFEGSVHAVSKDRAAKMTGVSFHAGCPVPLADLRVVHLTYWDMTGAVQRGTLVVHHDIAPDVVDAFEALFELKYPIEKMVPIEAYGGDDDKSMADNNTSSFNCRDVTGKPGVFSKHSYGRAIDLNPRINPYILKGKVLPPNGQEFADRTRTDVPGLLKKADPATEAFVRRGFAWGGNWRSVKDYQHFEMPAPVKTTVKHDADEDRRRTAGKKAGKEP